MKLTVGEKIPEFAGVDQDGNVITSENMKGKYWLLYFYPKDETPGCTKEACGFRDAYDDLVKYVNVIGVSTDSKESHIKFREHHKLPFPLISDSNKVLVNAFGADGFIFPKRVSYLIDPEGRIIKIYEKVNTDKHAKEVLDDVKMLV